MGSAIPQEGTTSNRYTVLGRLARGGMADIFLARAATAGGVERYVVLKRVLAERSRDPDYAKMFLDEARLASQLQHPNIAQVHDVGTLAGAYFFTMEYVHGEDVRELLLRLATNARSLPVNHALHIAAGALAALHHAHDRTSAAGTPLGVVHRDVSPMNVMVSFEGVIKLLDFGVANSAQQTAETQTGSIKGKVSYLSPEQCRGFPVDRRSDIFSLGIVLYEMLTGTRLYKSEAVFFTTMSAIVGGEVPPPSTLRDGISPELDRIVMTALAKDPAQRFATAADMLEAIESVAASEHHVMSATAMGRFLRELFGERPMPWLDLQVRDDRDQPLTITAKPIEDLQIAPGESSLEAQLEQAPALALWRADESTAADAAALDGAPLVDNAGIDGATVASAPLDSATVASAPAYDASLAPLDGATVASAPAYSAPLAVAPLDFAPLDTSLDRAPLDDAPLDSAPLPAPTTLPYMAIAAPAEAPPAVRPSAVINFTVTDHELPSERPVVRRSEQELTRFDATPFPQGFEGHGSPTTPAETPPPSRRPRVAIIAVTAITVVVIAIVIIQVTAKSSAPAIAAVLDAAVAMVPPDALVVVVAPDAPAVVVDVPKPSVHESIVRAIAAKDWAAALGACREVTPRAHVHADLESCASAACNLKDRAAALTYHAVAPPAAQRRIDRVCRDRAIILVSTPVKRRPTKDPCDLNPLRCQK